MGVELNFTQHTPAPAEVASKAASQVVAKTAQKVQRDVISVPAPADQPKKPVQVSKTEQVQQSQQIELSEQVNLSGQVVQDKDVNDPVTQRLKQELGSKIAPAELFSSELSFKRDKDTDEFYLEIIDPVTKKVLKTVPPEELRELAKFLRKIADTSQLGAQEKSAVFIDTKV